MLGAYHKFASSRFAWSVYDLGKAGYSPLWRQLIRHRMCDDRSRIKYGHSHPLVNCISSSGPDGTQRPLLDLDCPHFYLPSTTKGHGHLGLNVPMSRFKWSVLMAVLGWTGVLERGYVLWSLRRGANFIRTPDTKKEEGSCGYNV
jgi:hypothetical protein